ncbi:MULTISPECIES: hypothetical protein [Burkholderia]|uniref:hypothetical protein n=1 Tax=unclassified Burkholderia TaxID=2613784 RepID=UPI002011C8F5|nr:MULTISPECIES: hypothetical protein [unclassified Burkholderia]
MLRRKSEWQELRRCQPDGWNGIPPARYGWPGIGHVPLRTGRNALPQAARMLPQVRAARRTFFMENRPGSNRRLRHPIRRSLLRSSAAQAEIAKLGLDLGRVMA